MNLKAFAILILTALAAPSIAMAGGAGINVEYVEGNQITVFGPTHISTHTSIVIEAPVEVVWATVMDEDKSWSPSYFKFDGPMEEGATVHVSLHDAVGMSGGEDATYPFEWSYVEGHRFGWSGPAVTGGPIYDNHQFVFTAIDEDTTLFVQSDDSTSTDPTALDLSSEQVVGLVKTIAEKNYMAFNRALKAEAEARYQAQ